MAQFSTKKSHLRHSHISPAPFHGWKGGGWRRKPVAARGFVSGRGPKTDQLRKSGPLTCQVIKEGKTSREIKTADQAGDQEGKASHGIKSEDSKKRHQWISLVW